VTNDTARIARGFRRGLVAVALVMGIARVEGQRSPAPGSTVGEAVPKPRSPFGIVTFDLKGPVPKVLARLGTGVVRGSCNWADLEPARGAFNWSCSDDVIVGAQTLRLRSYMTVGCTPAWANNGAGCRGMPADIADWYGFVANFVSRYTHFDTILGVWNEPNLTLDDTVSGANYALLFINASNARNTVNANFPLAGPETSHHAAANGYYRQTMGLIESYGALDTQDIVAVHWYPDGPALTDYLDAIHDTAGSHEVWLSETGYATADLKAQADFYGWLLQTFVRSDRAWWTHVIFYRLWDGLDCCTEAIVTSDFTPKPAFDTYRDWIEKPFARPR